MKNKLTAHFVRSILMALYMPLFLTAHAEGPLKYNLEQCPIFIDINPSNPTSCNGQNGTISFKINVDNNSCSCGTIVKIIYKINRKVNNVTTEISSNQSVMAFPATVDLTMLSAGDYEVVWSAFIAGGSTPCNTGVEYLATLTSPSSTIVLAITEIKKAACTGSTDGSFKAAANGGTAPYMLSISPGTQVFTNVSANAPATFDGLAAGTYTVTATAQNQCTSTSTVTIGVESGANFTIQTVPTPALCFGGNNGAIALTPIPNAMYHWSNGATTADLSNLFAGTYTITVTVAGCDKEQNVTVGQPAAINIAITKTDISCTGLEDGKIGATASGGNSNIYTYTWSANGATVGTASLVENLKAGIYSLVVADSKGCTKDTSGLAITDPGSISASIVAPASIKTGTTAQILVNTNNPQFSFVWTITNVSNATISPGNTTGTVFSSQGTVPVTLTLGSDRSPGGIRFQVEPFRGNCKATIVDATIFVLPADDLFIPEIYTPNGDGSNDTWNLALPQDARGTVTIFNRAGGQVYEGDALSPWDGSGCPDGTYFFVLRYDVGGEAQVKKGAVTILRTTE